MKCRISKGFTLIELLVVVSIIALLVSILMPALSKAREQARRAVCSSNMHSLGSVVNMYALDYNGKLWQQVTGYPSPKPTIEFDPSTLNRNGLPELTPNSSPPSEWYTNAPPANQLAYLLRVDIGMLLYGSYNMNATMWMCPSMEQQKFKNSATPYLNDKGGFHIWHLNYQNGKGEHGWCAPGFWIGYINIMNLGGPLASSSAGPTEARINGELVIKESPRKISDKPSKHLSADMNIKWYTGNDSKPWGYSNNTASAHRETAGGPPVGGNRLYLDGHVEWVHQRKMGYKDLLENNPAEVDAIGKYTHTVGISRWCFW